MVLGEQQNITKNQKNSLEPPTGFEPATCSLRMNWSSKLRFIRKTFNVDIVQFTTY